MQAAVPGRRFEPLGLRVVDELDGVRIDLALELGREFGPFGVSGAGQVLDPERVVELAAEAVELARRLGRLDLTALADQALKSSGVPALSLR